MALLCLPLSFFTRLDNVGFKQRLLYSYMVCLLSKYRKGVVPTQISLAIPIEPDVGSPSYVYTSIAVCTTQDYENSLIELNSYYSYVDIIDRPKILEVGAGYGRNAYVNLFAFPGSKYFIVDIPPAIWISQSYLHTLFGATKSIFGVSHFDSFDDVKHEIECSDIIFLLPHQLALLPDSYFNFILNISSLHEMAKTQVDLYFDMFSRQLIDGGYFYSKQWKNTSVPYENYTLSRHSYPIPKRWRTIFDRSAAPQTEFFEALLQS